ncbi:DUF134 domain-containing protein [Sulfurovum sp.]|jgi:predicted DNA-binding protein (UPF0251 family)|uniref:DUF134 domain-containing protein n=1 Tax=Sulfurovum sp. TaxID=1969726 RepID=UPI002A35BB21|nr:DUF134 domain-containing protein [Sulfurovum sp.]MDD2451989.1 DUF134 domain-containing protein [Sulfurovum sp.]MDD3500519.1 DUF134 domain-containing protein [Sulfurovum sp.]MDY0403752.1 DUF134 domain-containing protein [Sulfurovum sp.]
MRNCVGRKRKNRNIDADHSKVCFKPCGLPRDTYGAVILYEDEMEAIRLADLELLYQEGSAAKMGISRTTFARLIQSAHQKIADALINQKAIEVQKR